MEKEVIALIYDITEKLSNIFLVDENTKQIYRNYFKKPELYAEELEIIVMKVLMDGYFKSGDKQAYFINLRKIKEDACGQVFQGNPELFKEEK